MPRRDSNPSDVGWRGKCPTCGKDRYESRTHAKRSARKLHPDVVMRPYTCEGFWHFGNTQRQVKRGRYSYR